MHALNLALFDALAAGFSPSPAWLQFASVIAVGSSWACAAALAWIGWRRAPERLHLLAAVAAGGAASLISHEVAAVIGMPRPFVLGLSPPHVPHGVRAGLPSTHASVMFTMAFVLLWRRPLRDAGLLMLGAALLTGWARIHVGIHFPLDIAAGALLAATLATGLLGLRLLLARGAPQLAGMGAAALRLFAGSAAAPCVVLVFAAAAAWIGLRLPHAPVLLEENGPIELGTMQLYLAAALCFLLVRVRALSRLDRSAICAVLLAFAAREADWHLAPSGAEAAWAVFAASAAAAAWLAARAWSQRPALGLWLRRCPEAATWLTFLVVVGTAVMLDQMPAPPATGATLRAHVALSFEEVLELVLPVLALLAVLQARLGAGRAV